MDLCAASRRLNAMLGGQPDEMLCSRAWREQWWTFIAIIDAVFYALRGERHHCRSRWEDHAGLE